MWPTLFPYARRTGSIGFGTNFPRLDAVCREGSSLYFIQVKTGGEAEKASNWMEKAVHFAKLLFDMMPIEKKGIEVSILVGTEPSRVPTLGKRKRDAIDKTDTWDMRYVAAPVASEKPGAILFELVSLSRRAEKGIHEV